MSIIKSFRSFPSPMVKGIMKKISMELPELSYAVGTLVSDIMISNNKDNLLGYCYLTSDGRFYITLAPDGVFEKFIADKLPSLPNYLKYSNVLTEEEKMEKIKEFLMTFTMLHEILHIMLFHLTRYYKIKKITKYISPQIYYFIADEMVNELLVGPDFMDFWGTFWDIEVEEFLKSIYNVVIKRVDVLKMLDSLKDDICFMFDLEVDEMMWNNLRSKYQSLDIYSPLDKRCKIVDDMLSLLFKDLDVTKIMGYLTLERDVWDMHSLVVIVRGGFGKRKDEEMRDFNETMSDIGGGEEMRGFNESMSDIGGGEEIEELQDASEMFVKGIEERMEYVLKERTVYNNKGAGAGAGANLMERIIEINKNSSKYCKKIMNAIKNRTTAVGKISSKVLTSVYSKDIPAREMINKRNLIFGEEYAYLTRPYKRENIFPEINFFVDVSMSILNESLKTILSDIREMFVMFDVSINLYVWSSLPDDPQFVTELSTEYGYEKLMESIKDMGNLFTGGGTLMSSVIKHINDDDDNKINIIYTDGLICDMDVLPDLSITKQKNLIFLIQFGDSPFNSSVFIISDTEYDPSKFKKKYPKSTLIVLY